MQQTAGEAYVYAYADPANPDQEVWVAWSPTGEDREVPFTVALDGWQVDRAEQMPLTADTVTVEVEGTAAGGRFTLSEVPTYLWVSRSAMTDDAGTPAPDAGSMAGDAGPPAGQDATPMDSADMAPSAPADAGGAMMVEMMTDVEDGGCDCTTSQTPAMDLLWVGLLALGIRRRRRNA